MVEVDSTYSGCVQDGCLSLVNQELEGGGAAEEDD